MTKNLNRLIITALVLCAGAIYAPAAFINLDYSARTAAMGSACVALADDASSIYANPAGLSNLRTWEILMSYSKPHVGVVDLSESYMAAAVPVKGLGSFGVSWYNFADPLYGESAYCFAYSYSALNSSFGINVKYLTKAYTSNEWTALNPYFTSLSKSALSAGVSMYTNVLNNISMGFFIDDINTPDLGVGGEEKLPVSLKAGLGYRGKDMIAGLEILSRSSQVKFLGGAEFTGFNLENFGVMSFRVGAGAGSDNFLQLTGGAGIKFNIPVLGIGTSFDYGFIFPLGSASGEMGTHRVSLTVTDFYKGLLKSKAEELGIR
jgi:hypothetical protein